MSVIPDDGPERLKHVRIIINWGCSLQPYVCGSWLLTEL